MMFFRWIINLLCRLVLAVYLTGVIIYPTFAAIAYNPLPTFAYLGTFQAEVDFLTETGKLEPESISTEWRDHGPGYLLAGLQIDGQRGIQLPAGIYRWRFRLQRGSEPAQLPSSPVFRISVWDVTTGERLIERTLHQSDFKDENVWYEKDLIHSSSGREGHRFEPRVYWEDYVNGIVDAVRLEQAVSYPTDNLEQKALQLDQAIQSKFLDSIPGTILPGLIVARKGSQESGQNSQNRGDSATWTALYTTAQALRLAANPNDYEARANMERGFQALHHLHEITHEPGVVARYADADGQWIYADTCEGKWRAGRINVDPGSYPHCTLGQATCQEKGKRKRLTCPDGTNYYDEYSAELISEDIYTAFAFAVGMGYPLIANAELKQAIATDMKIIGHHFLEHDFRIVKAGAEGIAPKSVQFNPYWPEEDLQAILAEQLADNTRVIDSLHQVNTVYKEYKEFRTLFNILGNLAEFLKIISFGCINSFPFLPENLLPPINQALVNAIETGDTDTVIQLFPEFTRSVRSSLLTLHSYLSRASGFVKSAIECAGRLPNSRAGENYRDVLRYVDTILLPEMGVLIQKIPEQINSLKDLKFDASNALAAAHILSAARLVAPDEFEEPYYRFLLGGGKNLLQTMETWDGTEEKLPTLFGGDVSADKGRSNTNWRGFAALYNLIRLEPRPDIRERYRLILERGWMPSADEGNALYDVIRAASGAAQQGDPPVDAGVISWALANIPEVRTAYSFAQWKNLATPIGTVSGGLLEWTTDDNKKEASGWVRDPAPVAIRAGHEIFLWQRNPRKIGYNRDAEGVYFPSVDYLLPFYMARAAGLELVPPPTTTTVIVRPAQLLKTSEEQGITIGSSPVYDCKTLGQMVTTPPELGTLPGPYGQSVVGPNGAHLANGYGQVRILTAKGHWKLTVDVQPEGLYLWAEVCRDALHAYGYEGAEVKFIASIYAPATTQMDKVGSTCPKEVIATSGEQGQTLGSGWSSNTKELNITVNVPAGANPLGGEMGTFNLDGNGYDDGFARVRVIVYQRVEAFSLTKTPTGVTVYARIKRPHHNKGGAEIKIAVDLLGTKTKSFQIAPLPSVLKLSALVGSEAPPQSFQVKAANENCELGSQAWYSTIATENGDWAFLPSTGGLLPGEVQVHASAMNLQASDTPYRGRIMVNVPGATNNPQHVDIELYVQLTEPLPPLPSDSPIWLPAVLNLILDD